jgi:hypothetical protein
MDVILAGQFSQPVAPGSLDICPGRQGMQILPVAAEYLPGVQFVHGGDSVTELIASSALPAMPAGQVAGLHDISPKSS